MIALGQLPDTPTVIILVVAIIGCAIGWTLGGRGHR